MGRLIKFESMNNFISPKDIIGFLPNDIVSLIIWWIYQWRDPHDVIITLQCLKCTSNKFKSRIFLKHFNLRQFPYTLLYSQVYNIGILDWFFNKDFCRDNQTIMYAIKCNNLESLKWYREKHCIWNGDTCYYAASIGRLKCLQHLHQNGCPWDQRTCRVAAGYGRLK